MSGKYALIIANTEYTDTGLAQLSAPGRDAEDFAGILNDQEVCAFDQVDILLNQPEYQIREAIYDLFNQKKPDDLVLLYFSGHGVRDEYGALYLAVKNTMRSKLGATAVDSSYITRSMDQSRSKRQVLILDCCNSGAFAQGTKAATGVSIGTKSAFEGRGYGRVVLTASDSTQFAWEGDTVTGETDNSLFTHFLVTGLKGEADKDGDGRITIDELYDYAYEQIVNITPKQTPGKWSYKQQGEIVLRQSTRMEDIKPVPLPPYLITAIENPDPDVRLGAVQSLARLLTGKNVGLARTARDELERIEREDDSRRVSQAATQVLEPIRQVEKEEEERKAREEAERIAAQKAEEERIALEKAEAERKAKQEATRLLAEQKAEEERKAKREARRLATLKAKEERLAREKAEADRKAKEAARLLAERKAQGGGERIAPLKAEEERLASEKTKAPRKETERQVKEQIDIVEDKPYKALWMGPEIIGLVVIAFVLGFASLSYFNRARSTPFPPTESPAATEAPAEPGMPAEKVQIRWFVGLGTGTGEEQIAVQEEVVADFNDSQNRIELVLEVVDYDVALDTLSTQIASGTGPDIVGPVGWWRANDFYGQWLDLAPYIEEAGFDTSIFEPALIRYFETEEGQVALPFAVFPGAMYFIPAMFDEAGLNYPPQFYDEKYVMPDGTEVDWNWDTITQIARLLTIDRNGRNSTEVGFDPEAIVQVGYSPQWQSTQSIGTFYGGAVKIYSGDAKGNYQSTIPGSWIDGFRWYYEGMWGEQPFIATGPLSFASEFGDGNVFNSGKAAMALSQSWYTCCLPRLGGSGNEFQLAIQPMGFDGQVHGRLDADSFRIWNGTPHPSEAFEVFAYLITTGADKLLPVYDGMPAIRSKTQSYIDRKSQDYPFVTSESWNVFVEGLAYPDIPSSDQYQPNPAAANARFAAFMDLLNNNPGLDFDAEVQALVDDLNTIYNE